MRVLLNEVSGATGDLTSDGLAELYEPPAESWLRVNFVSTVDGAATGVDGRSGSINNDADKLVFDVLRSQAEAVVVGAGTLRTEGYATLDKPLVVLSRAAHVPEKLRAATPGSVLMATWAGAELLAESVDLLGKDNVLVLGEDRVHLEALRPQLAERGLRQLLSEGGPHLFHSLLAAGIVDELDLTTVPRLVAGGGPRIVAGAPLDDALRPMVLLEEHGTLLGRWFSSFPIPSSPRPADPVSRRC